MHPHVTNEVSLLRKLAPADLALIRFLPRMDTHVLGETILPGEAHPALLASERLQAEVAAHVARHRSSLREHFAADVAWERTHGVDVFERLRWASLRVLGRFLRDSGDSRVSVAFLLLLVVVFNLHIHVFNNMGFHVRFEAFGRGEALFTRYANVGVFPFGFFQKRLLLVHEIGAAVWRFVLRFSSTIFLFLYRQLDSKRLILA